MNNTLKYAVMNAVGTAGYVIVLVSFIFNAEKIFGSGGPEETLLIPIAMLLLFVFSAAVTGFLVFGRPILWYLDGKKQEALSLLGYTLGIIFIIILFAGSLILLFK